MAASSHSKPWPVLRAGDLVDVIAPASACPLRLLAPARTFLQSLGLRARIPNETLKPPASRFLAQTDSVRSRLLNDALIAKDSKAIWCLRGGYGSMRVLATMPKPARVSQKVLIGYSDITSLFSYVQKHYNWSCLHGPLLDRLASGKFKAKELRDLQSCLFESSWTLTHSGLQPLNLPARKLAPRRIWVTGGNLAVLQSTLGTANEPSWKNSWLFLEDTGEKPHQVDRMLQHFLQVGVFKKVSGVLLGDFIHPRQSVQRRIWHETLLPFFSKLNKPVFGGLKVGHGKIQRVLPLGWPGRLAKTRAGLAGGFELSFVRDTNS